MLRTYGRIRVLSSENDPVLKPQYSNIKGIEGIYYVESPAIIKDYFEINSVDKISSSGFLKVSLHTNKEHPLLKNIYNNLNDINLLRDVEVFVKYQYYSDDGNIYEWRYNIDKKPPVGNDLGVKKKIITNNNISDLYYSEDDLNELFYKRSYFSPLYYYTSIGNNPNKKIDNIGYEDSYYIEANGVLNKRTTVSMSLTSNFEQYRKYGIGNIDKILISRYPNPIGNFNHNLLPYEKGEITGQISYPQYRNNLDPNGELVKFVDPTKERQTSILRSLCLPSTFSNLCESLGDRFIKVLPNFRNFEVYDMRGNYFFMQHFSYSWRDTQLNVEENSKATYFLSRAIRTPDDDLVYIPQIHYGPSVPLSELQDDTGSPGLKINYIIRDLLERDISNLNFASNTVVSRQARKIRRLDTLPEDAKYAGISLLGLYGQYYKTAYSEQLMNNPTVDKLERYIKENHIVTDIRLGDPVIFTKNIADNVLSTPEERERSIHEFHNAPNYALTNIKFEIDKSSFRYSNIDQEGLKPYSVDRTTFLPRLNSRLSYGYNHNLAIDKVTATFRPIEIKVDDTWKSVTE